MMNPFISRKRKSKDLFLMTPAMAAFLLEHYNPVNCRPIDKAEVRKRYARAIQEGEWDENTGIRIIFEVNTGNILDGQHRLAAIAEAGIAVRVDVLWGINRASMIHHGGERRRSIGQRISAMLGEDSKASDLYNRLAKPARQWMNFIHKWELMRFTTVEMKDFILKHKSKLSIMIERRTFKETRRAGVAGALAFYYSVSPNKAMQFFDMLTGDIEQLKRGSPILALHTYLTQNDSTKRHPETQLKDDFTATLSACSAYEHGETMRGITHREVWP